MNSNPHPWKTMTLKEVARRVKDKNNGRSENVLTISAQHGLVSQTDFFNKSVASKNLNSYLYIEKGDFAYNKSYSDGYPLGAIKRLERYDSGILSTLYICFRPNENIINANFLKYLFESTVWHREISQVAKEGGRSHGLLNIGINDFFDIKLNIPPLKEQKKIADILTSVDEAIEKTEAIIKQTESVKKALMQQLLTKGIGHTKFKQTEIGEIPEEWEIQSLRNIGSWSGGGTPSKQNLAYWVQKPGLLWVSPKDMYSDIITDSEDYITEEASKDKGLKILAPGTILFVTRSGILRNRVPISMAGKKLTINQDLKSLTLYENINNKFIFYLLQSFNEKIRKSCVKIGTTVESIDFNSLKEFKIPIPSLDEQYNISSIIEEFYKKINIENNQLSKLRLLKKGLMQSLLTGKVRVNVDESEVLPV
ncbi:restriction endonuclease subunit S [Paenibacillus wulumuqiensis]|uniref:restriction endonuclease subunit S n=1 Tax=Paenibacillus wulumuqiensis TaxID=1567107 RepID=UPI001F21EE11|nr:restriction endonuclease subunit S [Paenibacillus wulumuqiensis]